MFFDRLNFISYNCKSIDYFCDRQMKCHNLNWFITNSEKEMALREFNEKSEYREWIFIVIFEHY